VLAVLFIGVMLSTPASAACDQAKNVKKLQEHLHQVQKTLDTICPNPYINNVIVDMPAICGNLQNATVDQAMWARAMHIACFEGKHRDE
jgi:enhancing lycopene biosynthesis protein 2